MLTDHTGDRGLPLFKTPQTFSGSHAKPAPAQLRDIFRSPATIAATAFGFGTFPVAPGTVGAILALPLVWLLSPLATVPRVAIYVILFALLVAAAHQAASVLGEADHPAIICDETWAMAVVWDSTPGGYGWMIASFLVFRLFDIMKPWPIVTIDRSMKNGFGVMLDDAVAAALAIALILAAHAIVPLGE